MTATPAIAATTPDTVAGTVSAPAPRATAVLPKGKVVSRITLNIRQRPSANSADLGGIQPGTIISLSCKVTGQNVDGNNLWYLLGGGRVGYVAARYVKNLSPVPYCVR
ncbi:SH3 domain-containing protein [Streptomyces sp. NPDC126933]|uniref:SH3 domain-containing protein n=1 Tax=unclassified Streptomyces TaxID=2593676 RepID=UPI00364E114A